MNENSFIVSSPKLTRKEEIMPDGQSRKWMIFLWQTQNFIYMFSTKTWNKRTRGGGKKLYFRSLNLPERSSTDYFALRVKGSQWMVDGGCGIANILFSAYPDEREAMSVRLTNVLCSHPLLVTLKVDLISVRKGRRVLNEESLLKLL